MILDHCASHKTWCSSYVGVGLAVIIPSCSYSDSLGAVAVFEAKLTTILYKYTIAILCTLLGQTLQFLVIQ